MKKQLDIFFAALMFLTRIPVPRWVQHTEAYLQKATKYFTLVGIIVGTIGAGTYYLSSLFLSNTIAILLSMIATVFTTGSFHEDGFADVCDAFGGGYTKEKILEIMKDSRLGTYGTIGLILIMLLKFFLLLELSSLALSPNIIAVSLPFAFSFPLLMVAAHSVSRFMPLVIIQSYEYVFQNDLSKSKPLASQKLGFGEMAFAFIVSIIVFIFLPIQFLAALLFMGAITYGLGNFFKKWIGGYTGDCLGTVQQVSELVFLLSVLLINKILFF